MGFKMSERLSKARAYEKTNENLISESKRPVFHLTPLIGWMNDPNGFSYYKGQYHMFYQYYPYDTNWGDMHWGHAVSKDLLDWHFLPAALAPDEEYDKDGCFSGSAVELPDKRHLLMYTGVIRNKQPDGTFCDTQTQCLAVGDGIDYVKYDKNPVLDKSDLPIGGSSVDFRDPKLWQRDNGTYYCVTGNRPADGSGQILLYESTDGFKWKFKSILCENRNRIGKMWECPDFFKLDGQWVLLTSPQDMLPKGYEYNNGNGTLCLIGSFDEDKGTFKEEYNQSIDYGIDFYATQTILSPDGRRIMIGWMQNWDTCTMKMPGQKWYGQMSLPRELSIVDNRLYQKPIREIEALKIGKVAYENVSVNTDTCVVKLEGVSGRVLDMEINIRPKNPDNMYQEFTIHLAENVDYYTLVWINPSKSLITVDRKFSGSRRALVHERSCKVEGRMDELKLRIIMDRYSVEVFVNDGRYVMSTVIYTPLEACGISFAAEGEAVIDVEKYELVK
jgi:beta-fructofuranosidase